ncbi:hypothetical protein [Bradyrhizobium zhanjiangense]|uniref:DUF4164 family protein n=1 Tax=Bradyrhizobium zhanjiangense TaxID=1325107 RepID=A0ABY0DHV5_9BRAD|nr:hypothetical protein [Bradyrhizobium zhanjiangense]RXG91622.1 hypothetical protein EAS62_24390 [Bradyrhizobium zhanjiangense]
MEMQVISEREGGDQAAIITDAAAFLRRLAEHLEASGMPGQAGNCVLHADALALAARVERVDQALARQLSRSMQENARLHARISELEEGRNAEP